MALYVYDEATVKRIFPESEDDELAMRMLNFKKIRTKVHNSIFGFLGQKIFSSDKTSKFVPAFSKILCYLNKFGIGHPEQEYNYRILMLQNSDLPETEFSNIMNCVHVCMNRNIIIDAISFTEQTTGANPGPNRKGIDYLKQACKNTKGLFNTFDHIPNAQTSNKNFIQLFLHCYNMNKENRDHFKMP